MPTIHNDPSFRVYIYFEDHGLPHVHVYAAEHRAKIEIDSLEIVAGSLPPGIRRAAIRWIEANRDYCLLKWRDYGGA